MKVNLYFGQGNPWLNVESERAALKVNSTHTVDVVGTGVRLTITLMEGSAFIIEANPWPTSAQLSTDKQKAKGGSGRGTFREGARVSLGEGVRVDLTVQGAPARHKR